MTLRVIVSGILPINEHTNNGTNHRFRVISFQTNFRRFHTRAKWLVFCTNNIKIRISRSRSNVFFRARQGRLHFITVRVNSIFTIAYVNRVTVRFRYPYIVQTNGRVFYFSFATRRLVAAIQARIVRHTRGLVAATCRRSTFTGSLAHRVVVNVHRFTTIDSTGPTFNRSILFFIFGHILVNVGANEGNPHLLQIDTGVFK